MRSSSACAVVVSPILLACEDFFFAADFDVCRDFKRNPSGDADVAEAEDAEEQLRERAFEVV